MSIPSRQVLLSVSETGSISKIEAVAQELDIELVFESAPEAILKNSGLAQADCIVVEFSQFGISASSFLDACRRQIPNVPVIALLRSVMPSEAVRFGRSGIFECLDTFSTTDQIFSVFESAHTQIVETRTTRSAASGEPWRRHLVGQSPSMEQIIQLIRLIAARRCTVLISGETGTGKEMAARAIHMASDRCHRPMVSVNCSAIP
jgi:DNA-binding NtrC family response regulator